MKVYLEHANISVSDLNKGIRFFKTAFPEFYIRGRGVDNGEWVHFGDETYYIALGKAKIVSEGHSAHYLKTGINHLGFVVEDVEALSERLLNAGYKQSYPDQYQPTRIRKYFLDQDENEYEYEFIQYLSETNEERNNYNN